MDMMKIGGYILRLRKSAGMTQKQLADKLGVSFQAVSKWENGESLPDTGLIPEICDILNTTADKLLNGGSVLLSGRRLMRVDDVIAGFECIENVGRYFGENSDFYTGMVEGINTKMNIDFMEYLNSRETREVLWAEVLIQGILSGRTVDMDEVKAVFTNRKMIQEINKYSQRTADAKERWGSTEAYKEFEKKTAGQSKAESAAAADGLMEILSVFGRLREKDVSDPEVQAQVKKLQDYITEHYYTCTKEILAGLGGLYAAGGEFTENIDSAGGAGTAGFAAEAIAFYCR